MHIFGSVSGRNAALLVLLLFQGGCNIPFRSKNPEKLPPDPINGPYYYAHNYTIAPTQPAETTDSLTVQYLGCGGLYIRKNKQAFLVDPFFSNIKMLPGLKIRLRRLMWLPVLVKRDVKIKPHINSIELGYGLVSGQPGYVQPKAVLLTHGHYDHMLDVPYLYKTKFTATPAPIIYGNLTSVNLLQDMVEATHLRNLETGMQNQHNSGTWITIGDTTGPEHVRFMAIEADHAPHAKSLKLFDGDAISAVGNYATYLQGTPINKWLEGRTLGLLVDFMEGSDTIAYRMFIQTSASTPTRGFISEKVKKEKAVDLAVICVASFELVEYYPDLLLDHLQPQQVMLVHWEDFIFKSYQKNLKKPKTIGFSDVKAFIGRMQEIRNRYNLTFRYYMPAPGAIAKIKFDGKSRKPAGRQ